MKQSRNSGHFEDIESEILLAIMKQLPDLVSLDSLIRASPRCFRIFNTYAVDITQAVLSAGYTHGHIQMMICIIAMIRSSSLPIPDLAAFRERITDPAMERVWEADGRGEEFGYGEMDEEAERERTRHEYARFGMPEDSFTPTELPKDTSPRILRSILASARQNTCLGLECLEYHLGYFRSLRPMHLVDSNFKYWPEDGIPRPEKPWELDLPGKDCQVHDIGPPTWEEEQRAIRACWRLQTYHDLRKAAASSRLPWPDVDIETMNHTGPLKLLYDFPTWNLWSDGTTAHPELEELKSILSYLQDVKGLGDQFWPQIGYKEVSRTGSYPEPLVEDMRILIHPSSPYLFFYCSASGKPYHDMSSGAPSSPLAHVSFNPFRPLGFAFWSNERMAGYGLADDSWRQGGTWYSTDFYLFAWRSILSADELAEVTRRNEARGSSWIEQSDQAYIEVHEDYAV